MAMDQKQVMEIEDQTNAADNLDLAKLRKILVKSLPFVLLILLLSAAASTIAIRYTKQLFEAKSILQIDIKSEAKVFGFKSFDDDINNLAREIEIIKSRLFLGKVAEAIQFDVSYYQYGDILFEERYRGSPFTISHFESSGFFNRPIDLEILDRSRIRISYSDGGIEYSEEFYSGDTLAIDAFKLVAVVNDGYEENIDNKYFFTVNTKASIVGYINQNLTVEPLDFKAKTISVTFKDHNRHKAADIVNAIDTLYLYYTQLDKNKATKQKINFLDQQLTKTEAKLSELEDYFENFTIRNKTTNLDANLSRTIIELEHLDSQRFVVQNKIKSYDEIYDNIIEEKEFDLNPANVQIFSSHMQQELNRLNTLYHDMEMLLSSYNKNTFAYQKKESEINFLKKRVMEYIETTRESLYKSLDQINVRKNRLESEFVELPSKRTEYSKTERYYSLYEEFYLSLMKNKAQFELAQAGTTTDYRILSSASAPTNPISPNKLIYYGIGLMIGLFISFVFVGTKYLMHNKITNQHDLEQASSAFILGSVPYYSTNGSSRFVINKNLKSEISEAFRTIRTNLEFINGQNSKSIITITSTISGEGKSFIAANLGGIISLLNNKVLMIDLDMRKPRFHEIFENANSTKGLSTILINKHSVEECIQKTELDNLDYIPAGPIPPNPSELILGSSFAKLINDFKKSYDVIVIDTPPVGLVTDGIHALKISDIPIYIFRADYSKKSYLKNIQRLVKVNKISNLSLILNSTRQSETTKYGYKKGYYYEPNVSKKKKIKNLFHF